MSRLGELLPFNEGETVGSYCSRLAAACGYRHARSFTSDLGFRYRGLTAGDATDVSAFAKILDVSETALSAGVVVVTADRMIAIAQQKLTRGSYGGNWLRMCPHCILEDEQRRAGRRGFRAFGRLNWLVGAIRTCREHGTRLVSSDRGVETLHTNDFAAHLALQRNNFEGILLAASEMEADSLQLYVEARLRGDETGSAWLDRLPLYVVIRLCETVGATEEYGPMFHRTAIQEREWSKCAGLGFDLLCDGEIAFREWLVGQIRRFYTRNTGMGGPFLFGRLYEFLAHSNADVGYDPLKDIMRDVAMCNLPFGPGDEFFGVVTERRLHSVHSASREFGIHPARLLKLLINSEIVPGEDLGKTYERILIKAETMESFSRKAARSISLAEARAYVGASPLQFASLVKSGRIKPNGGNAKASTTAVISRFDCDELETFLTKLRSSATCTDDDSLSGFLFATRSANCTTMRALDLLMKGELDRVALSKDHQGLAAIRVDLTELKKRVAGIDHGCLPQRRVERLIPASGHVVNGLLDGGHLRSVRRRNPVKGSIQRVVDPKDLAAFKHHFVSLGNLAIARRTTPRALRKRLESDDIMPVFIAADMPFYQRSQVEAF